MVMGKKGADSGKLELQMTSMIDVVFLLLIFFMVTLRIPEPEGMIETALPKAKGTGSATTEEEDDRKEFEDIMLDLVWNSNKPGQDKTEVYVNRTRMLSTSMTYSRLKMMSEIYEDGRVVVRCQNKVPYKNLVEAISLVQEAKLPMAFADLD